mgnify:CR=1 FL=1
MRHQSSSSQTTVAAKVFDLAPSVGPLAVAAPALLVAGVMLPTEPIRSILLVLGLCTLLGYDARPQRRARELELVCKPGVVSIPGGLKIRARDLLGATSARHEGRVSLMLSHKARRGRPIILDLPDDAALMTVCRALGIGHHGFGYVDAIVSAPPIAWIRYLLAGLVAPFALATLAWTDEALVALVVLGVIAWVVSVASSWSVLLNFSNSVRLTPGGVFLPRWRMAPAFLGFDKMEEAQFGRNRLVLTAREPDGRLAATPVDVGTSRWNRFSPSEPEMAHLASQLHAALERAHGKAAPERAPAAFASVLERTPGESLRDWLARVDTIAMGSPGYRSSATASAKELWEVFEDPYATPNVRAAAARMLKRLAPDELRVRVADVLSTVRDERARVRIAASIDDDALAREEELELRERTQV